MTTNLPDRVGAWTWVASLAFVAVLMLRPLPDSANELLSEFPPSDLIVHFSFFLYLRLVPHSTTWGRASSILIAAGLITFGVALEGAQALTATRIASWGDVAANTIGVLTGHWLCPLLEDGRGKHDR